ncbi:MAG: hypothetical protein JNM90_08420 [Burkholderiales bacterium]|nr:hypothetical protein [Burkholderiales bacterium]
MQRIDRSHAVNPFAMLGDSQAVADAIRRAQSWNLKSRVCHPLDRPSRARLSKELAQFDAFVDAEGASGTGASD